MAKRTKNKIEFDELPIDKSFRELVGEIESLLAPFQHSFDIVLEKRGGRYSTLTLTAKIKDLK